MTAAADLVDELFRPVGYDPAWSESYSFNFVDPDPVRVEPPAEG